jgi:DNA-binding NarL/FixJ family response regulator
MSLKILLVDNKIPFLDSAIRYLNLHDRVKLVGWALSGAEALDKIKIFQPDLVLIDVSLPDTSGLSAIREIKKQFNSQKIAVLTLHDSDDYRYEAELAGADGFISKIDFVTQFPGLIDKLFTV